MNEERAYLITTDEIFEADFFDKNSRWVGSDHIRIYFAYNFEGGIAAALKARRKELTRALNNRRTNRNYSVVVADDARLCYPLELPALA